MRIDLPLLRGFLRKLVLEVMPPALASAIGGVLFTHYGLSRAPGPVAAQVAPAPPEMMQLLRDEHGLIVTFLKAQVANEKEKLAAADATSRTAAADAAPQPAAAANARQPIVAVAVRPVQPRSKVPVVGASLPPLVIAQAPPNEAATANGGNPDSLVAKTVANTVGIKDHVVAVTQSVVSAIGGIPSWFGSIGDRIGGEDPSPRPRADVASASS
jgi:hypothetical protein